MGKAPRENRVPIMMSEAELTAVDDWRFTYRIATRSEAIRRLVRLGLNLEDEVTSFAMGVQSYSIDLLDHVSIWLREHDDFENEPGGPEEFNRLTGLVEKLEPIAYAGRRLVDQSLDLRSGMPTKDAIERSRRTGDALAQELQDVLETLKSFKR